MSDWIQEEYEGRLRLGARVVRPLFSSQSEFQTVEIVETEPYGKLLRLGGTFQTSVGDEHYYHEMLVHPALTTAASIRRVLVVGGGDGGTVREVLRYQEVDSVTMCELDRMVTDACREHIPEMGVPWNDPRLELVFRDGVAFLAEAGEPYDVILLDGPDPVGPAAGLFAVPFFESAKRRLAPGGVFALQSESPVAMRKEFVQIAEALRRAFERVRTYFAPVPIYPSGLWSFSHASRSAEALEPMEARLAQIEPATRYYNRDIHRAAFAQSNEIKKLLAAR